MTKHYILQAVNSDGQSVFIDDVPNGKKCRCFCKECKGALIAKQGNIKAHHFAHANGNDSIKCSQTALHLLAKEIITNEKRIPAFVNGKIDFVSVELIEQEKNLGDIKPDLYAMYDDKPIAIEIFVSHAVDSIKFQKIQAHKLTTFEINLSELVFETRTEVRNAIYDLKNVRPIYDEVFTEKALVDKKKFIDTNGMIKNIVNGNVLECPMKIELRGMQGVFSPIKASLCESCPFGYKLQNETAVHCIGHLKPFIDFSQWLFISRRKYQRLNINVDYTWQVSVSKNKIVSLAELADFLTCITGIKFTENTRKQKKSR